MRVTMLVFSQTGNTLRVADAMADALESAGHDVTTLGMSLFAPDETGLPDADLLLVGSPTFFSRAPMVVRDHLSLLPELRGMPAWVFVTSGGASGRTLWDLRRGLERRGALVLGGAVFTGEVRFPARALAGRNPGRPDAGDLDRAAAVAAAVAEAADRAAFGVPHPGAGGEGSDRGVASDSASLGLARTTRGLWGFYGLLGLALTPAVVRRVLRAPVVDRSVCNRCRWCVGACPVDAIQLAEAGERRPRPAERGLGTPAPVLDPSACVRCYRCLACPVGAYSVEQTPGAEVLIGLLYHRRLVTAFGDPEGRRAT